MGYNNEEHFAMEHTLVIANTDEKCPEFLLKSFLGQEGICAVCSTLVTFEERKECDIEKKVSMKKLASVHKSFKDEGFVALVISAIYMGGIQMRYEIFNDGTFRICGNSEDGDKLSKLAEMIMDQDDGDLER